LISKIQLNQNQLLMLVVDQGTARKSWLIVGQRQE
jgi:hypothetical protein